MSCTQMCEYWSGYRCSNRSDIDDNDMGDDNISVDKENTCSDDDLGEIMCIDVMSSDVNETDNLNDVGDIFSCDENYENNYIHE